MKRLHRSKNRSFLGVLGGFGEYWKVDQVMLRVLFVLLVILSGFFPGVVAYFIAALIMPGRKHSFSLN